LRKAEEGTTEQVA
jgi:hypothetical protein